MASVATRKSTSPDWKISTWALRVRGRERAEHHRRAAALAADQLGDGVDLVGREGDDGRAARQAGDLLRAGIGEHRHARPGDDVDAGEELLDDAAHGRGAEEQRLLAAAEVEHAVGEDVAALEVAGELDLVDGEEGGVGLRRHRLDGADAEARRRRDDLLLAGDQRDLVGADARDDAVIDLAREQPERQADDARRVAEHALDGEVGLAGIGGSEDGDHVAAADRNRGGRNAHTSRAISVVRRQAPCGNCRAALSLYHSGADISAKSRISGTFLNARERVPNKTGPNR